MSGYIINEKITSDNITNDGWLFGKENEILNNPTKYYSLRKQIFYARDGILKFTPQKITAKQLTMLTEIKTVLNKQHTNYKIIISPLYDQIKFNDKDFKKLKHEIKEDIDDEGDERLNNLLDAVVLSKNKTITELKRIMLYLREKTYAADINELKNA